MAHNGGTKVNYGFYWSAKAWDMAMVPAEGGLLPGGSDRHYTRIPTVLFLLMAPLMGALYVVFLPVAGFALVGGHALRAAEDPGDGQLHAHRRGRQPELGARRGVSGGPQARQGRAGGEAAAGHDDAPRITPGLPPSPDGLPAGYGVTSGTRGQQFGRRGWMDTGWGPGILKPRRPSRFFRPEAAHRPL